MTFYSVENNYDNPIITCTAWRPTGECCANNKGKQIRTCTPSGCQVESRCYGSCLKIV